MVTANDTRPIARLNTADHLIEFQTFAGGDDFAITVERCKAVLGAAWDRDRRVWTYPASPATAWALRNVWTAVGGFRADPAVIALVRQGKELAESQEARQALKEANELPDLEHMNRSAWLHQRRAFHFAKDLPAAGLFIGMGGGKTYVTIALLDEWNVQTALIECPLSVVNAWCGVPGRPGQFQQHSRRDWIVCNLGEKGGTVANKLRIAQRDIAVGKHTGRPVAIVVNYDSARLDPFAKWATGQQWDAAVFDESHRLKEPGGVTAKHAQTVGRRATRKLLLTGTPMPHNPTDIYAQYRAVAPEIFGTNFAKFKNRYCILGGWMGKEVVGFQNQEELQRKIYSIAMRVTKEELDRDLGLPGHRHIYRQALMGREAATIYEDLAEKFVADVAQGQVTAANALVKLLRLAQVTSGYLPVEIDDIDETGEITTSRVWTRIDNAKERLLEEILEDLPADEPITIFARFAHDLDIIHAVCKKMGRGSLELSGRRKDLEQWQLDGGGLGIQAEYGSKAQYPILAVQEQAGGVGIDLTRASVQIFYSKGFSLGNYDQALARVDRPGQTRKVLHIHMDCEGTVDEYVEQLLTERRGVVEGILTLIRKGATLKESVQAVMERTDRI